MLLRWCNLLQAVNTSFLDRFNHPPFIRFLATARYNATQPVGETVGAIMPRKKKVEPSIAPEGDSVSSFLLPYDEKPRYELHNAQVSAPTTKDADTRYAACIIHRNSTDDLKNGTCLYDHPHKFMLHIGDYALLSPSDNSMRPAVARIHGFTRSKAGAQLLRVQWFYRAEDLTERPPRAVGEDEIFETLHYDDVQIATIAGRCSVNGYDVWSRAAAMTPKPQPVSPIGTPPASPASSKGSFFWDNYSDVAVNYYCRYMYDPYAHLFVPSRFENPHADPEADLAHLRDTTVQDARDADYEAVRNTIDDKDTLEVDEEQLLAEVESLRINTKRKREPSNRPRAARGVATREKAAQFCLPTDIGAGECSLPCRDAEKERVRQFLLHAIVQRDAGDRCLYVSGMPGTGKTATIREVMRELAQRKADMPAFEALEINGMSVPDPNMVYSELHAAISGTTTTRVPPAQAAALLERRFERAHVATNRRDDNRPTIVLLLDEMDVLVSRAQKVLYDLLDWPTRPGSRLAVIGVANTMDLPERMLPRIASRLGRNRLTYSPYTKQQLASILQLRLPALHPSQTFQPGTVQLCAAKVAAVSGDVRRALQLCARAAELARESGDDAVKPTHLNTAVQLAGGTARLAALTQLSMYEIVALVAAIVLVRAHGSFAVEETASVQAVCEKGRHLATLHAQLFAGLIPGIEELEECVLRLVSQRILLLEREAMLRNSRVIINLLVDDCCFALRDHAVAQKLLAA